MTDRTERPIAVGDLVQVINACCQPAEKFLGVVFKVRSVAPGPLHCVFCYGLGKSPNYAEDHEGKWYGYLKRIPPLSELENSKTDEPIEEPA
jgi:hypothetical protein